MTKTQPMPQLNPAPRRGPQAVKRARTGLWLLTLCGGLVVPVATQAAMYTIANNNVTANYGDDANTSTLAALNAINGQSALLAGALNAAGYNAGNGWNVSFAGQVVAGLVTPDLTAPQYQAWVGSKSPTFTDPGGTVWGGANLLGGEGGGAYIRLAFNPGANDPLKNLAVHWIQAYTETVRGVGPTTALDAGGGSPFYDATSAAGQTYFADIPFDTEQEYEKNPVSTLLFNVYLAVDSGAGGGFAHNLQLYSGYSWGYTYTATDIPVPEVSTTLAGALAVLVGIGLTIRPGRKRAQTPATTA